jgi:hypothetical protein
MLQAQAAEGKEKINDSPSSPLSEDTKSHPEVHTCSIGSENLAFDR